MSRSIRSIRSQRRENALKHSLTRRRKMSLQKHHKLIKMKQKFIEFCSPAFSPTPTVLAESRQHEMSISIVKIQLKEIPFVI